MDFRFIFAEPLSLREKAVDKMKDFAYANE